LLYLKTKHIFKNASFFSVFPPGYVPVQSQYRYVFSVYFKLTQASCIHFMSGGGMHPLIPLVSVLFVSHTISTNIECSAWYRYC